MTSFMGSARKRQVLLISSSSLVMLAVILVVLFHSSRVSQGKSADLAVKNAAPLKNDICAIENVSLVKRQGGRKVLTLSAEKIIHRNRVARLFVYQNLTEIFMTGVKIHVYHNEATPPSSTKSVLPVHEIGSSLASLSKSSNVDEYMAGTIRDIDLSVLSRISLEDLTVMITFSDQKTISMSAGGAFISNEFENLVLLGPVRVEASDGLVFSSSTAVWTKEPLGIYFPEGCTAHQVRSTQKSFYTVSGNGRISKAEAVPDIVYADVLDERERVVMATISKNMPGYARVLFGLQPPDDERKGHGRRVRDGNGSRNVSPNR